MTAAETRYVCVRCDAEYRGAPGADPRYDMPNAEGRLTGRAEDARCSCGGRIEARPGTDPRKLAVGGERFREGAVRVASDVHECDGNGSSIFGRGKRARLCQGMIGRGWEYLAITSTAGDVVFSRHCLPCAREFFAPTRSSLG